MLCKSLGGVRGGNSRAELHSFVGDLSGSFVGGDITGLPLGDNKTVWFPLWPSGKPARPIARNPAC